MTDWYKGTGLDPLQVFGFSCKERTDVAEHLMFGFCLESKDVLRPHIVSRGERVVSNGEGGGLHLEVEPHPYLPRVQRTGVPPGRRLQDGALLTAAVGRMLLGLHLVGWTSNTPLTPREGGRTQASASGSRLCFFGNNPPPPQPPRLTLVHRPHAPGNSQHQPVGPLVGCQERHDVIISAKKTKDGGRVPRVPGHQMYFMKCCFPVISRRQRSFHFLHVKRSSSQNNQKSLERPESQKKDRQLVSSSFGLMWWCVGGV